MTSQKTRSTKPYALASLAVSLIVIIVKYLAYIASASIALKADAAETLLNVISALGGLFAIHYAEQPADVNHTYGHYKAEYLFSVAEGVFILITAVAIGYNTWTNWFSPHQLSAPFLGIALSALATFINFIWAVILKRGAQRSFSPALNASAHHIFSDVWNGLLLIVGLTFIPLLHLPVIDTVLACFVVANILMNGWKIMHQSLSGLMDEAPDETTQRKIRNLISQNGTGAIEAHEIRMRIVSSVTFLEFHLVVPGNMCVNEAHAICDHIEKALHQEMRSTYVTIHVEPENHTMPDSLMIIPPPSCSL